MVPTLLCVLMLGACAGDVNPYLSAVNDLSLPSGWHETKTISRGNGGEEGCVQLANPMCPSVTRYYSVAGDLPDLFKEARAALGVGGFSDIQETAPNCDLITNVARCSMAALRDAVRIEVYLFAAGDDVDGLGIAVPGEPTVRIITRHP